MKRVEIHQLPDNPQSELKPFCRLAEQGLPADMIRNEQYIQVWAGERGDDYNFEKAYYEFNLEHPADFKGHSLSISDVVVIDGKAKFCNLCGWVELVKFY